MNTGVNKSTAVDSFVITATESHDELLRHFFKRMKLLVVDAEERFQSALQTAFSTTLIDVVTACNRHEATTAIAASSAHWHCWIMEINLECEGLDIVEDHPQFPFVIIHSGMGSMEQAARAIRLGVAEVIDKTAGSINRLITKTCALLPLGMLCRGMLPKNRDVFFTLTKSIIINHREWAEKVNLSLRQLENICNLHTGLSPSLVLPFYYGMQYLLHTTIDLHDLPVEYVINERFFLDCLEFVSMKIGMYGGLVS